MLSIEGGGCCSSAFPDVGTAACRRVLLREEKWADCVSLRSRVAGATAEVGAAKVDVGTPMPANRISIGTRGRLLVIRSPRVPTAGNASFSSPADRDQRSEQHATRTQ